VAVATTVAPVAWVYLVVERMVMVALLDFVQWVSVASAAA
jgi:hypothetical protein